MCVEVILTLYELRTAATVGISRQLVAINNKLPDRHGYDGRDPWQVHIEGACGECAVAKALGIYWAGTNGTFKTLADVAALEVKTRSEDWHELIVRHNDQDDAAFVLVTGKAPKYCVRGWIYARDAKREEWLKPHGGRPAEYFVPQKELHDIRTVPIGSGVVR